MLRFAIALIPTPGATLFDIFCWFCVCYLIYTEWFLLAFTFYMRGFAGIGAQRWICLSIIQLQPSQLMTVVLARYFHSFGNRDVILIRHLILPAAMISLPVAVVLKQPDLGTAMVLLMDKAMLFFRARVCLRIFSLLSAAVTVAMPIV